MVTGGGHGGGGGGAGGFREDKSPVSLYSITFRVRTNKCLQYQHPITVGAGGAGAWSAGRRCKWFSFQFFQQ